MSANGALRYVSVEVPRQVLVALVVPAGDREPVQRVSLSVVQCPFVVLAMRTSQSARLATSAAIEPSTGRALGLGDRDDDHAGLEAGWFVAHRGRGSCRSRQRS